MKRTHWTCVTQRRTRGHLVRDKVSPNFEFCICKMSTGIARDMCCLVEKNVS